MPLGVEESLRRPNNLQCRAQPCRAGARVLIGLDFGRRDAATRKQRCLGDVAAATDRQARRADAFAGQSSEKLLHATIF